MPRLSLRLLALVAAVAAASGASAAGSARPARYLLTAAVLPDYAPLIEVLTPTGRVQRVVAKGRRAQSWDAQWSPDGSMLARLGPGGVSVERANGGGRRLLVRSSATACCSLTFAWSPDGRRLLVGGADVRSEGLLSVPVAGGAAATLAQPAAGTVYSAVGWAGSTIVYTRAAGDPGTASCCSLDVIAARADGSEPHRLFRIGDGGIHDSPAASLSPDGRLLAFTTDARDLHDPRLAVIDVRTGRVRAIRGVSTMTVSPAWSPDSRRLAVATLGDVLVLAANGRRLGSLHIRGGTVDWSSRGGLTIVSEPKADEVYRSPDGRRPARLLFRMPKRHVILRVDVG